MAGTESSIKHYFRGVTNPKWLSIKIYYFFQFFGCASWAPFMVPFYASIGLTTPQIGIIEVMAILTATISRPILGSVADKSGRHSLVLALTIIGVIIPLDCLYFVPHTPQRNTELVSISSRAGNSPTLQTCDFEALRRLENSSIHSNSSCQLYCPTFDANNFDVILNGSSRKIDLNCSEFPINFAKKEMFASFANATECKVDCSGVQLAYGLTFWLVLTIRCVCAISLGPSFSIPDAIAYDMLGVENRALWGQQRMFGTLAWGLGAGIFGALLDYFHSFAISFVSYTVFTSVSCLIAFIWLPKHLNRPQKSDPKAPPPLPFGTAVRSLFTLLIFNVNCVIAITSGMLFGITQIMWPQLMKDLHAPKMLFGMAAVTVCTFEIPGLFFAGAVVDRIGEVPCFLLMFLAYIVRFVTSAFVTPATIWISVPVEGLHLFCFGLYFPAATRVAAAISPPGTSSTVQAIVATSYGGIGAGSGVLLASLAYHSFGQFAFLIYAGFAALCGVILLIAYFAFLRKAFARIEKESPKKTDINTEPKDPSPIDPLMSEKAEDILL